MRVYILLQLARFAHGITFECISYTPDDSDLSGFSLIMGGVVVVVVSDEK